MCALDESNEGINSEVLEILFWMDNDSWPTREPTVLWTDSSLLDNYLREWVQDKDELRKGEIMDDEYFEWKIQWPDSADDCGKHVFKKQWRINSK